MVNATFNLGRRSPDRGKAALLSSSIWPWRNKSGRGIACLVHTYYYILDKSMPPAALTCNIRGKVLSRGACSSSSGKRKTYCSIQVFL